MIEHMFDTTSSPLPHEMLASIAATLSDLTVRVERLDSRIDTAVTTQPHAQPEPEPSDDGTSEWVWDGNRGWPRTLGRPAGW
jgi:hypothetical protein